MNEKHMHFVNEMREFGSLSKIDPSLPSSKLEAHLNDDYKFVVALESAFVNCAPLTEVE